MGIGHLGVGFAAKSVAPKASLGVLLLASEMIDILWIIFALVGLDKMSFSPWSHSLLMSIGWSVLGGAIAYFLYRDRWTGLVIGLVIFSHWMLDFISHPMGVVGFGTQPDLPLLFAGAPMVGLGLYNSIAGVIAGELLLALGIAIYLVDRRRTAAQRLV